MKTAILKDIQVIAFDCDGVLFNTERANKAYYNQILRHFGRSDMTEEEFVYAHMHTADKALSRLFGNPDSYKAAQDYRKKMDYLPFIQHMEIEPHLKPLLEKLRPRYKTAIATNRSDTMETVLLEHGLHGHFDLVVSVLDVERPKPHPDPLLKILNHFGIKPFHALFIGDSIVDEQAAKAAGVSLISYQNRSLSAQYYIDSLKDIENLLGLEKSS